MKLRPFFGFYGGKWRSALRYPPPEYDQVVEPFAGSAGYSVRHFNKRITLCDLDPVVAGVWHYLTNVTPIEVLSLPDLEEGQTVDDLRVSQEARWLIGFWLNRGVAIPCKRESSWMRTGLYGNSFWGNSVRKRIASQIDLIKHWRVFCCAFDRCPVAGPATWFVDPPYQIAGRHYRHNSSAIDYGELSTWVQSRRGQVIACENEGAKWLPFRHFANTKTTRKGKRSHEVIWTKGMLNET